MARLTVPVKGIRIGFEPIVTQAETIAKFLLPRSDGNGVTPKLLRTLLDIKQLQAFESS